MGLLEDGGNGRLRKRSMSEDHSKNSAVLLAAKEDGDKPDSSGSETASSKAAKDQLLIASVPTSHTGKPISSICTPTVTDLSPI